MRQVLGFGLFEKCSGEPAVDLCEQVELSKVRIGSLKRTQVSQRMKEQIDTVCWNKAPTRTERLLLVDHAANDAHPGQHGSGAPPQIFPSWLLLFESARS